jgi:hypothetical protein
MFTSEGLASPSRAMKGLHMLVVLISLQSYWKAWKDMVPDSRVVPIELSWLRIQSPMFLGQFRDTEDRL